MVKSEKIPAWDLTKVRSKSEVIDEARTKGVKVHFASLMDICHLKNAELETKAPKIQRSNCTPRRHCERLSWILCNIYRTRIISITNDGSKSHGYIYIYISRLPGCAGQAADAVSAYTQVRMEDAPKLLKIPKSECLQTLGFVYHDTIGQNHGPVWKAQSFLLSEICMVILWQDCYGKGNLRKFFFKYGWEKIPNWECLFVNRENGLFLSVYADDTKLAGKKQNIYSGWKVLVKEVDLGEPTSFLGHVYLGCTQRQCEISKDIVDNYRTMFESRISAGATEKLPCSENLSISSWSHDMEGHAKKCVERYCELANITTQQLKNPSIWRESLTWIVPWIRSVRGENLEGWHHGPRHWGVGNDGRIGNLLKKTRCKGSNFPNKMENSFFQSQMDE